MKKGGASADRLDIESSGAGVFQIIKANQNKALIRDPSLQIESVDGRSISGRQGVDQDNSIHVMDEDEEVSQ